MEDYSRKRHEEGGYKFVYSPHIANAELFRTSGHLDFYGIVNWQAENRWFIIHSPFAFLGFIIYFISVVAETNRTPFDIPEAESELVAGFATNFPLGD